MSERTTEPLVAVDDYRNVTDLLVQRAAAAPDHVAFDVETGDAARPWRPVTTMEYLREVRALAKGLIASGVEPGDAIAILAPTRYEWAVADLASWFAGAVVVPVYETSAPEQVAAIVRDAGVRLGIGGRAAHVALLADAFAARRHAPGHPDDEDQASGAAGAGRRRARLALSLNPLSR